MSDPSLDRILDALGYAHTAALMTAFGGQALPIPPADTLTTVDALSVGVGPVVALAVAEAFGGETLTIPKALPELRARRREALARDRAQGASIDTLARKYGLSRQVIRQTLNGAKRK